jgi:hypothetical protein
VDDDAILAELLATIREARRTTTLRRQEAARGRMRGEGKIGFSWVTENLWKIRIEPKEPYTV